MPNPQSPEPQRPVRKGVRMTEGDSAIPLRLHVEQRILERLNLGHLYTVENGPDGPEACCTPEAAASIWRVVLDAIQEAGWSVKDPTHAEPGTTTPATPDSSAPTR